jgi:uncharacterized BrkB/YihY/UPF0761 family membrane protein
VLAELLAWLFLQPELSGLPSGVRLGVSLAIGAILWLTTPYLLLGRRIAPRRLARSGGIGAVAMTLAGWASAIAMPPIVASSSDQFGTIGVAFAMLAWLTAIAMTIMASAVAGAELGGAGEARGEA